MLGVAELFKKCKSAERLPLSSKGKREKQIVQHSFSLFFSLLQRNLILDHVLEKPLTRNQNLFQKLRVETYQAVSRASLPIHFISTHNQFIGKAMFAFLIFMVLCTITHLQRAYGEMELGHMTWSLPVKVGVRTYELL